MEPGWLDLYVPADNGGVFRISATGADRSELIPRDKRPPGAMRFPQFLPDGRRFLFYASGAAASAGVYVGEVGSDKWSDFSMRMAPLWLLELDRNVLDRLTLAPGIDSIPVWSPDGNQIMFRRVDGTGEDELFRRRSKEWGAASACDWSPDGRFVLVRAVEEATGMYDLWALQVQEDRPPMSVVRTSYDERDGQFSPDGKLIAYQSDESGRPEIYVQPFPGPGPKVRISTDGGTQARWWQDGTELFYVSPDNRLISVTVSNPEPGQFRVGRPVPLFQTRMAGTTAIAALELEAGGSNRQE